MATAEKKIRPAALVPNPTGRELRYLSDRYEQAQRIRITEGERIRAVLQGRDETWGIPGDPEVDADAVLEKIRTGEETGPVLLLSRTYRRHWEEEEEMRRVMLHAVKQHPVWPWLERVRGVGPTLACKILARFDPAKAPTPSSFWAYAGLSTVPGEKYRCPTCSLVRAWPAGFKVTGAHQALGTTSPCAGKLARVAGPDDGIRAARPRPAKGEKASYDQYAKKICYLLGTSFLKAGKGSKYEQFYRRERAKLELERPGWSDARKHLTALRKVEKLFLAHLWFVWRVALDLPTVTPYAQGQLGHAGIIEAWEMVDD